jgi:hypothetical protein
MNSTLATCLRSSLKLGIALSLAAIVGCNDAPRYADHGPLGDVAAKPDDKLAAKPETKPAAAPAASTPTPAAVAPTKPPASDEDKASEQAIDPSAPLSVARLVLAHDVDKREPVRPSESFVRGQTDQIVAFVDVRNPESANSAVDVIFVRPDGRERAAIRLRVGESPRWRTWAITRLATEAGQWGVVVRDAKGKELARTTFEVVNAASATGA